MGYSNFSPKLLTVQEVATLLRLSVLTVYKYIKEGHLEAISFGKHYRIQESALTKFIQIHKINKKIEQPSTNTYEK